MRNKFAVRIWALLAAVVLANVLVPTDKVCAETEYLVIEEEEVPLSTMESEEGGNIAIILAGVSCLMTIGAAFIWLKSERKRLVDEEE